MDELVLAHKGLGEAVGVLALELAEALAQQRVVPAVGGGGQGRRRHQLRLAGVHSWRGDARGCSISCPGLPVTRLVPAAAARLDKELAVAAALDKPWHQPLPATSSPQRASTPNPAAGRQAGRQQQQRRRQQQQQQASLDEGLLVGAALDDHGGQLHLLTLGDALHKRLPSG